MAKNKTGLYIGLGAVAVGVIYFMTRKTTTTTTTTMPAAAPTGVVAQGTNLLSQGTNLVTAISKLFGGSSSPSPGTAAAFTPVSIAPTGGVDSTTLQSVSPASGVNYINPSAPAIPITAPAAPASVVADDGSVDTVDAFNSEA